MLRIVEYKRFDKCGRHTKSVFKIEEKSKFLKWEWWTTLQEDLFCDQIGVYNEDKEFPTLHNAQKYIIDGALGGRTEKIIHEVNCN